MEVTFVFTYLSLLSLETLLKVVNICKLGIFSIFILECFCIDFYVDFSYIYLPNSYLFIYLFISILIFRHFFIFLGRDYRQNPLAAGNSADEPIYDIDNDLSNSQLVHPSLARAVLESPKGKKASTENSGWFKSSLGGKESEFAREMLMFPLSIKNPAVSLMASRCVRTDNYRVVRSHIFKMKTFRISKFPSV